MADHHQYRNPKPLERTQNWIKLRGKVRARSPLVDYAKDKSSSFGLQLSLSSIGFDIGKSKGYDETLTNASITTAGNVSLTSGRDTALLGGNINGTTVDLDVGRDLTILSPQAQGWRDGFSFGLTVGVNPADWSVRGSKEDGFKAWSSGSGIVAAQGIDIKVAEDTTLIGALLQATDGDVSLDTGTLTVADLKDTDQYKNVGGSIGLSGGGLNSVGFSYEKKDKQGETRTTLDASGDLNVTIRDADKDGVAGTEADKAAAEQLLASINKDASKYQEITKDDYTKLSGELDVQNLIEFGDNLKKIQNYQRAQNAAIPETVAAQGPEAVDLYRDAIVRGLTGAELQNYTSSEAFAAQVANRTVYRQLEEQDANPEIVAMALFLTTQGERVWFDESSKTFQANLGNCGTQGFASPCGTNLETLAEHARNNPQLFAQEVHHIIGDAVADVLARYEPTLDGHAMSTGQSREFQESLATAYACAIAWSSLTGDPSFIRNLNTSLSSIDNQSGINAYRGMAGIVLEKIGPADPATGKGTPVDLAYVDDWMGQGISNEGELANRADRRTAAGIVLSGVVATPTKTYLDYSRITTANLAKGQSPVPRSLEEQIAWKEVLANPAGGTLLDLNSDVRFLKINGWQKMEYSTNTSRGTISIHYQYNTITEKPYDIKVVSKPIK